jgi:hypothetical protein
MDVMNMDREAFEQLVSQWLDDPAHDGLRAQIEQALAEHPEWGGSQRALEALQTALRAAELKSMTRVNWPALRTRIMHVLATDGPVETTDGADDRLDPFLRGLRTPEARVDWRRFRERVAAQVRKEAEQARVIRLPLRRWGAIAVVAAAAVILVAVLPRVLQGPGGMQGPASTQDAGQTIVKIVAPASVGRTPDTFASVRVTAPPAGEVPEAAAPAEPQFYLYIGPAAGHDSSLSSSGT